jgi:hypothetical protein
MDQPDRHPLHRSTDPRVLSACPRITVSYPHSSGPAQSPNVSVSEPPEETLSLGAQPVEEWFVNSTWSGMYCTGTVGTLDGEGSTCSTEAEGINYQPVFAVSAN